MGYDLSARNKNVDGVSFGAFSWPLMLEQTGMGYVLGCGSGMNPGTYISQKNKNGSPYSNDGFIVSNEDAKCMAKVARGYVSVQEFVNREWKEIPANERKQAMDLNKVNKIYRYENSSRFIDSLKRFAEFAEKSGGFRIN